MMHATHRSKYITAIEDWNTAGQVQHAWLLLGEASSLSMMPCVHGATKRAACSLLNITKIWVQRSYITHITRSHQAARRNHGTNLNLQWFTHVFWFTITGGVSDSGGLGNHGLALLIGNHGESRCASWLMVGMCFTFQHGFLWTHHIHVGIGPKWRIPRIPDVLRQQWYGKQYIIGHGWMLLSRTFLAWLNAGISGQSEPTKAWTTYHNNPKIWLSEMNGFASLRQSLGWNHQPAIQIDLIQLIWPGFRDASPPRSSPRSPFLGRVRDLCVARGGETEEFVHRCEALALRCKSHHQRHLLPHSLWLCQERQG